VTRHDASFVPTVRLVVSHAASMGYSLALHDRPPSALPAAPPTRRS